MLAFSLKPKFDSFSISRIGTEEPQNPGSYAELCRGTSFLLLLRGLLSRIGA
jgi:hypothetical protein